MERQMNNRDKKTCPMQSLPAELLEHTLWHLPTRDLFLAQQVCKEWQSLILGSTKLKCALFLLPEEVQRCLRWTYRSYATVTDNPYEEPPEKLTYRMVKATSTDNQGPLKTPFGNFRRGRFIESRFHVGRFNDLFFDCEPWDFWERDIEGMQEPIEFFKFSSSFQLAARSPLAGSWRNMHISQPPWRSVYYAWDFRKTSDPPGRRRRVAPHQIEVREQGKIAREEGVTIGHIVDKIKELEREVGGQMSWATSNVALHSFICRADVEEAQIKEQQDDSSDDESDFVGREFSPDAPDPPWIPHHLYPGVQQIDDDEGDSDSNSEAGGG